MKSVRVDKLGRIVIPIDYRKRLNIIEGSEMILKIYGNKISLIPYSISCRLCGKEISKAGIPLCEACIKQIKSLE